MHAVLGRQLRRRQLTPQRLQRHLRLELSRVPLPLARHRVRPSQDEPSLTACPKSGDHLSEPSAGSCPGPGHTGRGCTATGPARPRIHPDPGPHHRPHRSPPGQPGQPGLGRGGQHGDVAGHHRHHGPIDFVFDIDQGAALRYIRLAVSGSRPLSREVANSGPARPCGRDRVPACRPCRLRRQRGRYGHRHDPCAGALRESA